MKQKLILISALISFFIFLFGGGFYAVYITAQSEPSKIPDLNVHLSSEKLMSIVNDWRYAQGLQPYTRLQRVCDIASTRVKEIQINFSHNGFSSDRFCNKTEYCSLGENLSHGYTSEQQTFHVWLNSPEHKANLSAKFQYSCIACENSYCAQEFANF